MYASSSNSEGFSCSTINSNKRLNAILETFKARSPHAQNASTQPIREILLEKVKHYGMEVSTNK